MNGSDVVVAARAWLGTPYVHQQSCKGAGCDCLGLLRGVWADLGGMPPSNIPAYTMDWSEASGDERLWRAAKSLLQSTRDPEAVGDVLLFRMNDGAVAKHLGIQSHIGAEARFIHAYSGHGVIESALGQPWRRRIVARFRFPSLNEESH